MRRLHVKLDFVHPILHAIERHDTPSAPHPEPFNGIKHTLRSKLEKELGRLGRRIHAVIVQQPSSKG
jgi:hypothetical protein